MADLKSNQPKAMEDSSRWYVSLSEWLIHILRGWLALLVSSKWFPLKILEPQKMPKRLDISSQLSWASKPKPRLLMARIGRILDMISMTRLLRLGLAPHKGARLLRRIAESLPSSHTNSSFGSTRRRTGAWRWLRSLRKEVGSVSSINFGAAAAT